MPGTASLQAVQYYAHSRNAFWRIMERLFDIPAGSSYERRCADLMAHGIAVWDVLRACDRPGSLDANIDKTTLAANDFAAFFVEHPVIETLFFNGATAENLFKRHVLPTLAGTAAEDLRKVRLPSTSPAHASLNFEQKLELWQSIRS